MQIAARMSASGQPENQLLQFHPPDCAGTFSSLAKADFFLEACTSRRRLGDGKAQFQQFPVDAWRTPKRVLFAHAMNEVPQFAIDIGPAAPITGFPAPPGLKARPMPANNG